MYSTPSDNFLNLQVLAVFFTILTGLYLYSTRNFNYWKKRGIKTAPGPIPFLGNAASCLFGRKNPDSFLADLYKYEKDDKFLGFYVMNRPYLMVRDPELIKDILVRDFDNFSNKIIGTGDHDPLGNQNLFLIHNPPWKFIRTKLSPIFTSGKLKNMLSLMTQIRPNFDKYMDSLKIDGKNLFSQIHADVCNTVVHNFFQIDLRKTLIRTELRTVKK